MSAHNAKVCRPEKSLRCSTLLRVAIWCELLAHTPAYTSIPMHAYPRLCSQVLLKGDAMGVFANLCARDAHEPEPMTTVCTDPGNEVSIARKCSCGGQHSARQPQFQLDAVQWKTAADLPKLLLLDLPDTPSSSVAWNAVGEHPLTIQVAHSCVSHEHNLIASCDLVGCFLAGWKVGFG